MDLDAAKIKEILSQAAVLSEIRDTAGFKLIERTLRERAAQAAITGMEDDGEDAKPVDYWRGYVAACKDVVRDVDILIERGYELKQELEAGGQEALGVRIGRGGGSIATEEVET